MVHVAENLATAPIVIAQFIHCLLCALDPVLVPTEQLRRGMAESKDRLIDISYREESVGAAQQIHQSPLQGIGVLQLVHQDVVEVVLNFSAQARFTF